MSRKTISYPKKLMMMKNYLHLLLGAVFTFVLTAANANTYYISSSGGNDSYSAAQAQNPSTPWQSINKLNAFFSSLNPGDNVLFMRGDVFYGAIVVTKSGISGSPITIGSYGTGSNPVITGFQGVTSWTSLGNGVYSASVSGVKSSVNLVSMNGKPQQIGRYPNADAPNGGYLTYESFYGGSSITDNQLSSSPNWTGAEVVIRKQHYLIERSLITSHSGNTIYYTPTATINPANGPAVAEQGTNGFGYFIQRDARTLDQLGEWYYNPSAKTLQMFFGGASPFSSSIQISTIDTLINVKNNYNINISGLSLLGANMAAVYAKDGGNITVQNCTVDQSGAKGMFIFNCGNVIMDYVNTNYVLSNAIDVTDRTNQNVTITHSSISNTGIYAGMGSNWNTADYKGIFVDVSSSATLQYNNIATTGYTGIHFQGNNVNVSNNYIDYYNYVVEDGAGIYTYASASDYYSNRVLSNNIILNGIGAPAGTGGDINVHGIYLDGNTMNVNVLNNTVANIGLNGIFCTNPSNVKIDGNTSFNNASAIGVFRYYDRPAISNFSLTNNVLYPKYATQDNFSYANTGLDQPYAVSIETAMQQIGFIDNNFINTPKTAGFNFYYRTYAGGGYSFPPSITLQNWRSATTHDLSSKLPPKTISNPDTELRFEYNATNSTKTVPLDASYLGVDGTAYNGSISLQPYTSKILIRNGNVVAQPLTATATGAAVSCYGGNTTVTVTASGGTAPYTGTGTFTIAAGPHTFSVRDATGAYAYPYIEVAQPASALLALSTAPAITLTGGTTTVTVSASGGTPPYKGTGSFSGIFAGSYSYTVTDANGCTAVTSLSITSPSQVVIPPITQPVTPPIVSQPSSSTSSTDNGSGLTSTATATPIICFGSPSSVTVTGFGGTKPYSTVGTYLAYAGVGTLKVDFPSPVDEYTSIYAPIGAVNASKYYVLRFSTLGTTQQGFVRAYLGNAASPYNRLTSLLSASFGNSRTDHQFIFSMPTSVANANFVIEINQNSGTTYVDNIAVFECTASGAFIGANLLKDGQFESGISNITAWSPNQNQVVSWDNTAKIDNTYYYTTYDALGLTATSVVNLSQSAALQVISWAAPVTTSGGYTTIGVRATGGVPPYSGTGYFYVQAGTYTYTVTDANGCSASTTYTVSNPGARIASANPAASSAATSSIAGNSILSSSSPLSVITYPNPTTSAFGLMVQGGTNEPIAIVVSSADGKVLLKRKGTTNQKYTFGNDYIPGLYIIQVSQGKEIKVLKAVKGKM